MATRERNPGAVDSRGSFLTAEWRYVAMLNYVVDPGLLARFVPPGTELDLWQGKTFVSLVGFRFLNTRVLGVPVPFHRDFDEVNLRLYVRRQQGGEIRRGVVFVREIVPRRAVAFIARAVYNENYVALPMSHRIDVLADGGCNAVYRWRANRGSNLIRVCAHGEPCVPEEGSEQQFIAEHYWGYSTQRDGGSVEYRVDHPSWRVWPSPQASFEGDMKDLYGDELAAVVNQRPSSAFLAEGSAVTVYHGARIA